MRNGGGTLFTMTYYGSQTVVKNYNIMGVAKAALEAAVRYLAAELGPKGIRVHAISPGPLATRAASGIPEFDELLDKAKSKAPARSLVSIDDVGAATAFLAHDAARLITGETLYVDGGYHIMDLCSSGFVPMLLKQCTRLFRTSNLPSVFMTAASLVAWRR